MSLLICGFGWEWHEEILKGLVTELDFPETILISPILHSSVEGKEYIRYDFQDFAYCRYESVDVDSMPPIDEDILEKMGKCENLYLSMQDRLEIKIGRKIDYNSRKIHYYNDLRIMNGILETHKVDICIIDYIPHLGFDYVLYELCRVKGIKVVTQCYGLSVPYITTSRYFLNNIFEPIPQLKGIDWRQEDCEILSDRMRAYIDYYIRDKKDITSFVTVKCFEEKSKFKKIVELVGKTIRYEKKTVYRIAKLKLKLYREKRHISKFIKGVSYQINYDEKYFYFPLHYQPECTSLPMGGYYFDQTIIVDMIAALLPKGYRLYVKPHPNQSYLADVSFYKKIARHSNVTLVLENKNTYDLIDNSYAVVTITGTAGWEALVRGKPVMMFGYYFYRYAPGVFPVKTLNDCASAIEAICEKNFKTDVTDIKKFLNKLDSFLVEGYIDSEYEVVFDIDRSKNIRNTVRGYIEFIKNEDNWKGWVLDE